MTTEQTVPSAQNQEKKQTTDNPYTLTVCAMCGKAINPYTPHRCSEADLYFQPIPKPNDQLILDKLDTIIDILKRLEQK